MNKKQQEKFNKQMESYKAGIIEDLKNDRDISAIICGYGFTFIEDYNRAKEWILNNIEGINGLLYGYICMTCGKTEPTGVNKDGECYECVKEHQVILNEQESNYWKDTCGSIK